MDRPTYISWFVATGTAMHQEARTVEARMYIHTIIRS